MRRVGVLAAIAAIAVAQGSDEVRVSAHTYMFPQVHLTAQTNLVQLEVVVRDPRGHAAGGLRRTDFEVLDEGKPSDILAFSLETRDAMRAAAAGAAPADSSTAGKAPATPPPAARRSILLFFDDLHGGAGELQRMQVAARRFIKEGMGAGAMAAVFTASAGLTVDFTADADALTAAVDKLRVHQRYSENGMAPCPRITPYQAYLIDNNLSPDALQAAVVETRACANAITPQPNHPPPSPRKNTTLTSSDPDTLTVRAQASNTWQQVRIQSLNVFSAMEDALALLGRAPGTRVLLLVSTGFLSGLMNPEKDAATNRAIHAGIVINAIDAKGLWQETPGRPLDQALQTAGGLPHETFVFETTTIGSRNEAMNEAMAALAGATGGLFFHNDNDLASGFAQLAAVPETTYLLAIRPDAESAAGKYHKLKVRLTFKSDDYLQTRPGYFAPPKAPDTTTAAERPIDQQLLRSDEQTAIPVQLTARLGKTDKGEPVVSTVIHVDLKALKFAERDGRHVQKLIFIEALLDSSGGIVAAKEGSMDLALKDDTLARLTASGVNAGLTFPRPQGPFQLRLVVEDADGKLAAQNQRVDVPKQ